MTIAYLGCGAAVTGGGAGIVGACVIGLAMSWRVLIVVVLDLNPSGPVTVFVRFLVVTVCQESHE